MNRYFAPSRRALRRCSAALAIAAGTVAVAVAVAVAFDFASPAAAASCPSIYFIGVRGSGEHSGYGHTIGSVASHIKSAVAGVKDDHVDYPAVDLGYGGWNHYLGHYLDSVRAGERALGGAVHRFVAGPCGQQTLIVLAGYSQGAHIVGDTYTNGLPANERNRVAGVVLLGDPRFNGSQGAVDVGDYDRTENGPFRPKRVVAHALTSSLRSYCLQHDAVCNFGATNLALCQRYPTSCPHMHYPDFFLRGKVTYTQDAANFLIARGQARGAQLRPPGANPPGGGPTSGGGLPGSSGPVPAGDGAPAGGHAETVGGVTHTWTNYANAGGAEGPSIQTGQTVGVACKVQGFQVADGDTWWYEIASSPWNGAYYASADAFYNNGQTSGSLHGTPFVDNNVPDCATAPPPPATYAETVGGVTHTWTNYANAGGGQGPSIQTGQTVGVACKVQGFQVADGDTWWYKIASDPWNGAYYASADAFYNNGQTSGSLHGTPFVDDNVPGC